MNKSPYILFLPGRIVHPVGYKCPSLLSTSPDRPKCNKWNFHGTWHSSQASDQLLLIYLGVTVPSSRASWTVSRRRDTVLGYSAILCPSGRSDVLRYRASCPVGQQVQVGLLTRTCDCLKRKRITELYFEIWSLKTNVSKPTETSQHGLVEFCRNVPVVAKNPGTNISHPF